MLHGITGDQAASPTQPRLAMNCNCSLLRLDQIQELIDYGCVRRSPVSEDKIVVLDPLFGESSCIVSLVIESNDHFDAHFLENRYIICRCKYSVL